MNKFGQSKLILHCLNLFINILNRFAIKTTKLSFVIQSNYNKLIITYFLILINKKNLAFVSQVLYHEKDLLFIILFFSV